MEEVVRKFFKNKYNISIVMCCASCRHHMVKGDDHKRMCRRLHTIHSSDYLCKDGWEMSENLENAGKGGGRVKKIEYLRYVITHGMISSDEWEARNGSKYLSKR